MNTFFYILLLFYFIVSLLDAQSMLLNLGSGTIQERVICTEKFPCNFRLVADLDLKSRPEKNEKNYKSFYKKGSIVQDGNGDYRIVWDERVSLFSGYNEFGRGMELSELINFNGMMLAGDDRTGILFEILSDGKKLAPRYILSEGDGMNSKGMKIEWLTVKDGLLW
ncbi:hypothetical protein FG379_000470, partial [Cryptosporidium bovis]|uniref:uncharacterized protein n=1 Tax=Cryptosporidium bovis TaxID=310047 RepID=UPI00351A354C